MTTGRIREATAQGVLRQRKLSAPLLDSLANIIQLAGSATESRVAARHRERPSFGAVSYCRKRPRRIFRYIVES
jgi:hypothetical protein